MSEVVRIPPTIEALWRANFAGDRHDDDEAELLRCLWREAMDAKLASPIETPKDAYAKLWWARYRIGLGADEDLSPLSRRLLRVTAISRRFRRAKGRPLGACPTAWVLALAFTSSDRFPQ